MRILLMALLLTCSPLGSESRPIAEGSNSYGPQISHCFFGCVLSSLEKMHKRWDYLDLNFGTSDQMSDLCLDVNAKSCAYLIERDGRDVCVINFHNSMRLPENKRNADRLADIYWRQCDSSFVPNYPGHFRDYSPLTKFEDYKPNPIDYQRYCKVKRNRQPFVALGGAQLTIYKGRLSATFHLAHGFCKGTQFVLTSIDSVDGVFHYLIMDSEFKIYDLDPVVKRSQSPSRKVTLVFDRVQTLEVLEEGELTFFAKFDQVHHSSYIRAGLKNINVEGYKVRFDFVDEIDLGLPPSIRFLWN